MPDTAAERADTESYMIFFGGLLGLLAIAVWIFCIIDAITTPADQVRLLPKFAWVAVVILLVDLGSLAWLVAGRPWQARAMTPGGAEGRPGSAGFGMSATAARRAPARPTNPDDDDEFLASLSKRTPPPPDDEPDKRDDRRDDGPQPV